MLKRLVVLGSVALLLTVSGRDVSGLVSRIQRRDAAKVQNFRLISAHAHFGSGDAGRVGDRVPATRWCSTPL